MIRKSLPSGFDPMDGNRFSEKIMLHRKRDQGDAKGYGPRSAHRRTDAENAAAEILCRALAAVAGAGEIEAASARASRIHDRAREARRLVRLRAAQRRRRTAERRRLDHSARRRTRRRRARSPKPIRSSPTGCAHSNSRNGRSWRARSGCKVNLSDQSIEVA